MGKIQVFYDVMFVISMLLTLFYAKLWHKHFSINLSLTFIFIAIANLGYVLITQASGYSDAIMAQKIVYIGGCFLMLFTMLNIFDICKINLPKWSKFAFIFIYMAIYFSVLTIGSSGIFYKSVDIDSSGETLKIIKEYGFMHTFFYIITGINFILSFGAIIYSLKMKKEFSKKIVWLLFIPEAVSFFSFFGGRLITSDFDILPASYVFAQIMYLLIAHKMCLYDVTETAVDSLAETGATGFVSFDKELRYLGSNQTAKDTFPEISSFVVDKTLPKGAKYSAEILSWIEGFIADNNNDKYYFSSNDRIYLIDVNYLFDESKKCGYQLVITDDTVNQQNIQLMKNYNTQLEQEVSEKTADIIKMHNNLIRSMAMMVESRDNSTGGHIIRTSDVVEILMDYIMQDEDFTSEFNITSTFRRNIIKAAPLHDIGKIAVDDAVLKKPGRFTDEEYEKMKRHAPEGARVLHNILKNTDDEDFKRLAENVARYHHERMDGSGYPDHLSGEDIPIESRIMAIADVYDALVSKRVYKDSMSFEKANGIMLESFGKHFDSRLEKFYLSAREKIEEYYVAEQS